MLADCGKDGVNELTAVRSTDHTADPAPHPPAYDVFASYKAQALWYFAVAKAYSQAVQSNPYLHQRRSGGRGLGGVVLDPGTDNAAGWSRFFAGYEEVGGPPEHKQALAVGIATCEGSQWSGYYGTPHWSRAQFSQDTWDKIVKHFAGEIADIGDQQGASDSPHFVGEAVGWWVQQVSDVPSQWPHCYGGRH